MFMHADFYSAIFVVVVKSSSYIVLASKFRKRSENSCCEAVLIANSQCLRIEHTLSQTMSLPLGDGSLKNAFFWKNQDFLKIETKVILMFKVQFQFIFISMTNGSFMFKICF